MSEEEFEEAIQEWGFDTKFRNKKEKLYYMYCIAGIYRRKMEIIKISKNKCYRKIISEKGIDTSKWAMMRNYDNELKNNKFEIIEANIV